MIRVADYITKFIYDLGIKHIFLVTGGGAMHLNDAIAKNQELKYICCHHEQAVAMAADAYSRITENFGVGCVTSGPGATNAITGIINAWQDSTSCMIISGQSKKKETIGASGIKGLRQFGALEVDIISMINSITKYSAMITEPEKIRYHLEKAVYTAKTGRPGPVWLDIPLDIQGALIDPTKLEEFIAPKQKIWDTKEKIDTLVKLIKKSKRPLIIAGAGIRHARAIPELMHFIEKFKIPIVTALLGRDIIEQEHPLFIGMPGTKGVRSANFAVQKADLLICIGTSLKVPLIGYEYELFAPNATKVVIDIDVIEHQKPTIKIDLFIESDAKVFLEKLNKKCFEEGILSYEEWSTVCVNWKKKYPVFLEEYKKEKEINMYYFIEVLSNKLKNDDIIICDAGFPYYAVSQGLKIKKSQRYVIPASLGTMGYNLPASIGASVAEGGRRVICITGDGSMQMNIQELQTIVHNKLPIKVFILNNQGYVSIKSAQERYFGRLIGEGKETGVSCPDIIKIANAYGIKSLRISKTDELEYGIEQALKEDGPVICDVISSRNQEIRPLVMSEIRRDGTMVSKPLDDMYPFLDRKTYLEETNV